MSVQHAKLFCRDDTAFAGQKLNIDELQARKYFYLLCTQAHDTKKIPVILQNILPHYNTVHIYFIK